MFQRLECIQSLEDELKESKLALERLAQEKDQIVASLESEKVKVNTLTQEKCSALEEKQLALKEKELALEKKMQAIEEKHKAFEE